MTEDKPNEEAADEEQDWLPQESKAKAKKRRADYQQVESTCSACE